MTPPYKAGTALGEQTLSRLWECTRRRGDLPGFAKAITSILGAMRGEDEQEFNMTRTVLSDPVLTQKVLRLANSTMYSAFGQHVSTVSKAVLVLGTEAIGHLALGLKLIEELASSTPDSAVAHVEMEKAVLSGIVAQQVAEAAHSRHGEEAVVCAMLQRLGALMLTYYMPEQWAALLQHAGQNAVTPDACAPELLGLTLQEIGHAAALHWGLPASLVKGMRDLEPPEEGAEVSSSDWVAGLSTMASRCADALWNDDPEGHAQVAALTERYSAMLGVEPEQLAEAIEQAKAVAVNDLTIAPLSRPAEKRAEALAKKRQRAAGNKILLSGLADMRDMLETASPGQMVQIALETIYKGLEFSRAVAFVRNRRDGTYAARIGFGEGTRERLPHMSFEDNYEPNVFFAALHSDRVIFIENARDPKFAAKLPGWWTATLAEARSFVILPLTAVGQPTGFLYGDWDDSFPPIRLNPTEFALLNDLRGLVGRSIEQRHKLEPVANRG
ncbi:HDOD domain-containing protein [Oxalobacteraceae bacterium A2-2]